MASTSRYGPDFACDWYDEFCSSQHVIMRCLTCMTRDYHSQNELFHGPLSDARPGDVMMLRQEPYLVWLQLLERGNGYATVSCRGLELQRTSCHTAEASKCKPYSVVPRPMTFHVTILTSTCSCVLYRVQWMS